MGMTAVNEFNVLEWLAKCGVDLPPYTHRITIDLEIGSIAKITFDCFAQEELLKIGLDLSRAEVVYKQKRPVPAPPPPPPNETTTGSRVSPCLVEPSHKLSYA